MMGDAVEVRKLSDVIADTLVEAGAGAFFVFTGGAISHVIDSVAARSKETSPYYCFQNEQAAAFAAEAYSRTNSQGLLGVTLTTSGPGASNLISGIAGAWYDCVPAVFVTGQVRTWERAIHLGRLQGGFQELDIVSMARSVTKYAKTLTDPTTVREEIFSAVKLAKQGRPGPVLIDIPMDLQYESVDLQSDSSSMAGAKVETDNDLAFVSSQVTLLDTEIAQAKKPLLLVGGGVRHADQAEALRALVQESGIPTIATYAAVDILGPTEQSYLGVMGQFGTPLANVASGECDLVIALGSRFAQKQLGNNPQGFAPRARLVSVNIDRAEMSASPRNIDVQVHADLGPLLDSWKPRINDSQRAWIDLLGQASIDIAPSRDLESLGERPVNPYDLAEILVDAIGKQPCVVALDVGQNVVASVQSLKFPPNMRVFSSWGNSPMGYSLPAAIDAWLGNPDKEIVCVIGDGGLQVNIQELQTIVNYKIPVKILLWNNHAYVTIHEYQDGNLERRYEATDAEHGYSHPDFVAVAKAYGIPSQKFPGGVNSDQLANALFGTPGPILVEVEVDPAARLSPSVKGTNPIHELSL